MYSSQIAEKVIHYEKQLKTDHYENTNDADRMIIDLDVYFYECC